MNEQVDVETLREIEHRAHRRRRQGGRRAARIAGDHAIGHSLGWIGSSLGTRQYTLGVDRFGESGTFADLHELTGIDAASIVTASLVAVAQSDQ